MGVLYDRRSFLKGSLALCAGLTTLGGLRRSGWGSMDTGWSRPSLPIEKVILPRAVDIRVVGVGGAGCTSVEGMIRACIHGVNFIAIHTDEGALSRSSAGKHLLIGTDTPRNCHSCTAMRGEWAVQHPYGGIYSAPYSNKRAPGCGACDDPRVGRKAAEDDVAALAATIIGADIVFIVAGLGDGTGTGAAPVIARIARDMSILSVGLVSLPFRFEGEARTIRAQEGLSELETVADSVITIQTPSILAKATPETTIEDAFRVIDDAMRHAVAVIPDILTIPGFVAVDYHDVRALVPKMRRATVGYGVGHGTHRARDAAHASIVSLLLTGGSIRDAAGMILHIRGDFHFSMDELASIIDTVTSAVGADTPILYSAIPADFGPDILQVSLMAGR